MGLKAHDHLSKHRLAGPRFSDEGRHLAGKNPQSNTPERFKRPGDKIEGQPQIFYPQQILARNLEVWRHFPVPCRSPVASIAGVT